MIAAKDKPRKRRNAEKDRALSPSVCQNFACYNGVEIMRIVVLFLRENDKSNSIIDGKPRHYECNGYPTNRQKRGQRDPILGHRGRINKAHGPEILMVIHSQTDKDFVGDAVLKRLGALKLSASNSSFRGFQTRQTDSRRRFFFGVERCSCGGTHPTLLKSRSAYPSQNRRTTNAL